MKGVETRRWTSETEEVNEEQLDGERRRGFPLPSKTNCVVNCRWVMNRRRCEWKVNKWTTKDTFVHWGYQSKLTTWNTVQVLGKSWTIVDITLRPAGSVRGQNFLTPTEQSLY